MYSVFAKSGLSHW